MYLLCSQGELDLNQQKWYASQEERDIKALYWRIPALWIALFAWSGEKTSGMGFTCPQLNWILSWEEQVMNRLCFYAREVTFPVVAWFDDQSATTCTFMFLM